MTWRELRERFSRPFYGLEGSTGFSEFLWSASCEKKEERRPRDETVGQRADRSFQALYERLSHPLLANLNAFCGRWGLPSGLDAEQIANDTWSLAYGTYWSPTSQSRMLGQATILTLLNSISRHLVQSTIQKRPSRAQFVCLEDVLEPVDPDPFPCGCDTNAARVIKECLPQLPPKCRLVAHMHFVEGISNSEIARLLRIERAAVSNHLKKAERRLKEAAEREAADFATL
ncbi:MAG: sigma-70 family RNA polymerase sigma factor [Planctomycetota bacterium]